MENLFVALQNLGEFLAEVSDLKGKKKGRWQLVSERAERVKRDLVEHGIEELEVARQVLVRKVGMLNKNLPEEILEKIEDEEKNNGLLGLAQAYEKHHTEDIGTSKKKGDTKLELLETLPGLFAKLEEAAEEYDDDLDDLNEDSKKDFKNEMLYKHFQNGVTLCMKAAKSLLKHRDLTDTNGKEYVDSYFELARDIKRLVKDVKAANDLDSIKTLANDFYVEQFNDFSNIYGLWYKFRVAPITAQRTLRKPKVTNQNEIDAWERAKKVLNEGASGAHDLFDTLDHIRKLN